MNDPLDVSPVSPEMVVKVNAAANRLHHVGMAFAGAVRELGSGTPALFLPAGFPGLKQVRSLIDVAHMVRAEVNALVEVLVNKGVMTPDEFAAACVSNYDWVANEKAKEVGAAVNDVGLVFKPPFRQPPTK